MKRKTLFAILTCIALIAALCQNNIPTQAMGFPNEFKAYFDEHGISVPSGADLYHRWRAV